MNRSISRRRGVTLVLVIAALMLLAIVSAALVRLAKLESDRRARNHDRVQSAWLAEAGFERAWSRLSRDPAYMGETWDIAADQLDGRPARVEIGISPVEANGDRLFIEIQTEYPAGSSATVRTTTTFQALQPAGRLGETTP